MENTTARLARAITRSSSKQSYYTARLLVDKDLIDDCCRAYGYFRWADDVVDLKSLHIEERIAFIARQKDLIERAYQGENLTDLCSEEEIIFDLIRRDRRENSGLQSFIRKFITILEFDAQRKGQLINQQEINWYSDCLGRAVTDAIQYFIRNSYPYPEDPDRYLAATAAHITHMLRDLILDLEEGYVNIPREYLEEYNLNPKEVKNPYIRSWVKTQVILARQYFQKGKSYLNRLDVLRCKIAGYWYCIRFECVLDAIEKDEYILRATYNERQKLATRLKMAKLAITMSIEHAIHQILQINGGIQNTRIDDRDIHVDENIPNLKS